MNRILALARTLVRDWVRNREAVFFAFVFPIVLLLIFSFVFAGGAPEFALAVQNNDLDSTDEPSELSSAFVTALEEVDALEVHHLDHERDLHDVDQLGADTGYQRVLVIPEGFDASVRSRSTEVRMGVIRDTIGQIFGNGSAVAATGSSTAGDAVNVRLLVSPDDEGAGAVEGIIQSVVARFNDRSLGIETPTVELASEERGAPGLGAADYFLPALIVAMILFNGVMSVPSIIATFKRNGTLKRLAATPLRRREWILANLLQQSLVSLLVVAVMIGIAWVVFGVRAIPGPLSVFLILLGTIAFGALGIAIGSLIEDPGSAISLGGGIALPLMFVSGIFWELDVMPATLQQVAAVSPVTYYHQTLRELMILDSMDGFWFTTAVLGALAAAFVTLAVLLTDWEEFD